MYNSEERLHEKELQFSVKTVRDTELLPAIDYENKRHNIDRAKKLACKQCKHSSYFPTSYF